jgi:hypothetical protein
MPVAFFPHGDDLETGTLQDRLEVLMEAAERYKVAIMEVKPSAPGETKKGMTPREMTVAFNWQEIAKIMREIRELPESNTPNKTKKADLLTRLGEIYEVLRGAKMPKLEAVRIALMNEAKQLRGS